MTRCNQDQQFDQKMHFMDRMRLGQNNDKKNEIHTRPFNNPNTSFTLNLSVLNNIFK